MHPESQNPVTHYRRNTNILLPPPPPEGEVGKGLHQEGDGLLANPLPDERRGSSLLQQRGFAFLLRLFLILLAQQSFPLLRGWVGDSSALLKASGLAGFLLAPQPALAQAAVPAATSVLNASPGNQKVTLSWYYVAANPAITKWQYQQKAGMGSYGQWIDIPSSGPNTLRHVVTGLTNDTAYKFKVRAVNSSGNGAESHETESITPTAGTRTITLTSNPANGRVTEGDSEKKDIEITVTLGGNAPAGGLPVIVTLFSIGTITANGNGNVSTSCTNPSPATADNCWPEGTSLTIPAGQKTGTIKIGILGDTTEESDEFFTVAASASTTVRDSLGNINSITWAGDTILITIVDNDGTPVVPLKAPTGLTIVPGPTALYLRELWIRAHSRLGKIPVVLTLLGLSSSLECTTEPSNFPLWGEKVVFLASWGGLLISRKVVPTEMLPPNPSVLIHNWRYI